MPHRRTETHGVREAARGILSIALICAGLVVAGSLIAAAMASVMG